jgi:hypothetical protein
MVYPKACVRGSRGAFHRPRLVTFLGLGPQGGQEGIDYNLQEAMMLES